MAFCGGSSASCSSSSSSSRSYIPKAELADDAARDLVSTVDWYPDPDSAREREPDAEMYPDADAALDLDGRLLCTLSGAEGGGEAIG